MTAAFDPFAEMTAKYEKMARSTDPLRRAIGKQSLEEMRKGDRKAGREAAQSTDDSDYPASIWAHVPLAALFEQEGNVLDTSRSNGEIKTTHQPVHGSKSNCVVIWPDRGRYHCSSCNTTGDAVDYRIALTGDSYSTVAVHLRATYGNPTPKTGIVAPLVAGVGDGRGVGAAAPTPIRAGVQLVPQAAIDITVEDAEELVPQVWNALTRRNRPHLFKFGDGLFRLGGDGADGRVLKLLTDKMLLHEAGQAAEFIKTVQNKDGTTRSAVRFMPTKLLDSVMGEDISTIPLPTLRAIVNVPVFAPDGELLTTPGYHPGSQTYYHPRTGFFLNDVPNHPSTAQVDAAKALLFDEVFDGFLFHEEDKPDPGNKANAIAFALLPYVRGIIRGPTPIHCVEAGQERTGKGKLVKACLYPALGAWPSAVTQAQEDEEWRKLITTQLIAGMQYIFIDNVSHPLYSGVLAKATTDEVWNDRILGGNKQLNVPVNVIWCLTGNNPIYSAELRGRRVLINIFADQPHPETKTGFKHPDLESWLIERRTDLVWSALVLIKSWFAAGAPKGSVTLGSYESWAHTMSGILEHLQIPDFMQNTAAEAMLAVDPATEGLRRFVAAWWLAWGDQQVTTKDLVQCALTTDGLDLGRGETTERGLQSRLGKLLNRNKGRVVGDWRVNLGANTNIGQKYRLHRVIGAEPAVVTSVTDGDTSQPTAQSPEKGVTGSDTLGGSQRSVLPHKVVTHVGLSDTSAYPTICKPDIMSISGLYITQGADVTPTDTTVTPAGERDSAGFAYQLCTDDTSAGEAIVAAVAEPVIGFDLETTGLDPLTARARLAQIATKAKVYIIDLWQVDPSCLSPLFTGDGPQIAGHNLKFDLSFVAQLGFELNSGRKCFDTQLAGQLLHAGLEHPKGTYSLAGTVKRHLGITLDKELQTSDWSADSLSEDQLAYAAKDAAILLPLVEKLKVELQIAGLEHIADIEMRCIPLLAHMTLKGIGIDTAAWSKLADDAKTTAETLRARLDGMVGPGVNVLWSSPAQILPYLRSQGHKVASTDELTLRSIADKEPIAPVLLELRDAATRVSKSGNDWLTTHVSKVDGRVHASYNQLGTDTGRMSCDKPNMQNIPRDPRYRACFVPPPGRKFVKADYSQIELRIAAQYSGDEVMLDAYRRGIDLHNNLGAAIYSVVLEQVDRDQRQMAKSANFGLLYGAGVGTFKDYCARQGQYITEDTAASIRETFFATYPGLRLWQKAQGNLEDEAEPEEDEDYLGESLTHKLRRRAEARKAAYDKPRGTLATRTMMNRRRLNIDKYTEKLNTPVQGTGADILKLALATLWEDRHAFPTAFPVVIVHDEIMYECDDNDAESLAPWLQRHMEAAGNTVLTQVSCVAEPEVKQNWGKG